jgi:N-acetylmuramate 1-kinase
VIPNPSPLAEPAPSPEPRAGAIAAFLAAAGWGGARLAPLAGDASPRRYLRLARRGRTAVLMDAPPGRAPHPGPFLAVTSWLRAAGLSAPAVLAADPEAGLVLLEDLGDELFARLLAHDPAAEPLLYGAAIDLLAALHERAPPAGEAGWRPGPYDARVYLAEARLALDWYLPAAGGEAGADEAAGLEAALAEALAALPPSPPVATLRDYHAENLIWLPRRRGIARVGLLDYQDMLIGHPAYDLASLLADARRDTGPALRAAMIARYCARAGADPEAIATGIRLLAVQRNLKILGIFARLCRRDGKPQYLRHLPRVWDHLQRDLTHPSLAALAAACAILPAPGPATIAGIAAGAPQACRQSGSAA